MPERKTNRTGDERMVRKTLSGLSLIILMITATACSEATPPNSQQSTSQESISENGVLSAEAQPSQEGPAMSSESQNAMGAMSPEAALEYMKETRDLVIIDVAATRWYDENHFEGAANIPIEELDSEAEDALYMKIPVGRPVLMHCRRGMIVPGAYDRVLELRPDIPEISYIDGAPQFDEYNEWLESQQ
ncbi:MAG: rhodanese-like domain-containing protein [Hungatella hathewayi]|nr:rhodanese-like domain-containing protein [Hungatella hathewayi]